MVRFFLLPEVLEGNKKILKFSKATKKIFLGSRRHFFLKRIYRILVVHFPATETRFFIVLIEVLEGNTIKRAQTISASGLDSNGLYLNHFFKTSFFFFLFSLYLHRISSDNSRFVLS